MQSWTKTLPIGMLAVCLVALPSCSSDNDDVDGPPNDTPEGRAVNTAMAALSSLTKVGTIGRFIDPDLLLKATGPDRASLPGICSEGKVEFCASVTGGFIKFSSCNIGGSPVSGRINVTPAQGNMSFTLDIGPYEVGAEGSFFFWNEQERFYHTFDHLSVSDGSTWIVSLGVTDWDYVGITDPTRISGPPSVVTFSGTYTDLTTTPPTVLFINGESVPEEEGPAPGDIRLRVYSAGSFLDPLLFCDANLADGSASCDPAD